MSVLPGSRLSRYQILEEISRGGMGIVYRALDVTLNREVALKVLPADLVSDRDRRERFIQEAQAASALEHPNIAVIHEVGEADGVTFIAMELIRGEKLSTTLSGGPLPVARTLDLAIEIAEALARAHEKGVVHRDIKPANVMVTEQGHAKVIDFGLAKLVAPLAGDAHAETVIPDDTDPGVVLGTVSYMSPEQARGGRVDHRSDIFTFAIVLHEMLAGRPPFRGPSGVETLHSILNSPPPPLPALSGSVSRDAAAELQRIRDKCLEKAPDDRYQGMRDLVVDLRAVRRRLESNAVPAVAVSPRWPRWLGPAAAAAVIAVSVALFSWRATPDTPANAGGKPSVAVLHFENNTGNESLDWLRTGLTDMLVTDLSQSPNLEVLSTERVYEILNELNRADERALSSDTVREFARRAGVKTVLVGSYLKSGEAIRISVRLQDAIEGRIVTAERVDAHGEANLFPTIDDLTRRIKAKLELPATARGDAEILTRPSTAPVAVDPIDRGLRDVTTSSVAAYRYYAEGINLHDRGRSREAIPLFEKALEIDPQFALAMVKLAVIHGNGGRIERSREYAQRAFEHADRVTTRERYYIEGYHFTRRPTTVAKGLEAYETGLKLYPDHAASRNNLAVQYLALGREDDAVPHLEDLVRRGYTYPPAYQSLANAYARRGDFERSRQLLEGFIQRYPDVAAGHAYLGNVHAMSGRFDEALGAYARAEALEPDSGPAALGRFNVHVLKGEWNEAAAVAQRGVKAADGAVRFQGHVRASLVHLYRGRSQQALASLGAATQERAALGEGGQARQRLAAVRLARNEPAVALAVFGDRREADIGPGALRLIGVAQLFLGQTTAAASTMAELKVVAQRIPSDRDVRFVHLLAGQFALHRKDTGTAVAEFAAAARSLPRYSVGPLAAAGLAQQTRFALGTAQIAAGQSEQAEQTLRQIINATTERVNAPIEYVRSLYLLATILEQRNQAAESREYYRRFLEHWRDGDLDREKVADAERKLKAQSN